MPVRHHRVFLFTALLCAALLSALIAARHSAASQDFWQPLRPAAPATTEPLQLPLQRVELANPEQQTAELKLDDGSVEGGGLQDNLVIVNRLTPPSYPATLQRVRILFPTFNNQPDPTGKAIKLLIATDGSGSGTAPALASYTTINTTVPGTSLTNFFEITIPNGPTITGGDFYIGYQAGAPHQGVGFALDANNSNTQAQNRSYISLDNGASFSVITPPSGAVSAIAMMRAVVSLPNVVSAPAIDVAPTALNFGNITVNASLDQSLTIRNTGAAALTVSALTSSNPRFSFLSTTLPFTLTAGQQQALTVRFIPTVAQSETGTLTINSNDPTRASLTVPVTGAGFTPGSNAIALSSGAPQNGQIAGSSQSGLCSIGVTQYTIAVPAGAASLQIALTSNLDLDLYARFSNAIVVQAGQVSADFRATSLGGNETITISPTTAPALQAGTYYLAISNCTASTANFTLTATVSTNTTGQITEDLSVDDGTPESGLRGDGAFFVNRLTPSRYPSRLQRVRIYFAQISGQPDPSNQSIRLLVFNNPTFNSLPLSPSYLLDRQVTIPQITTPRYVEYDITENVSITEGDWIVGFQSPNPANGVACVLDASSTFQNRSFAKSNGPTNWISMNANAMIRAVAVSGTQPTCTYAIAPTSQNFTAAGGNGTVSVTVATGCAWTAASNVAWLTINSGASGSGNGAVGFTAAANQTTSSRTGTLTVAGQTFTVTQEALACTFSIAPTSQNFAAAGGSDTVNVTAPAGCAWTAVSNASWLSITSGASGSGNGAVGYTAAANQTTSVRTGTLTIAGQTYTVTQAAAPCTYSLTPTSQSFTATGGSGTVNVTTATGCAWTASSNDNWLSITSGASGSGNGFAAFTVAANQLLAARTGTLTIAGQTFTMTQAALVCTYALTPASQSFNATGSVGSFEMTTNGSLCNWTATSSASWLTIRSGASGIGNDTVRYGVADNPSLEPRTATITSGGQTHTVTQAGVVCAYALSSNALSVPTAAGNGAVSVATQSVCAWTATSNASWLTITEGASGTGSGRVAFNIAANTASTATRTATLTIAGQTFTVTQSAPNALGSVSAASYQTPLAPDSIAAIFGTGLATRTEVAATTPLPTTLADTTVRLRDSTGTELLAPLFFVSAAQVNYLIPAGLLAGNATVLVTSGDNTLSLGAITLAHLAPGIFTANASGNGVAAGLVLRVKADGSQVYEPMLQLNAASGRFVPLPIDLGSVNEQVFLILFGTGFRNVTRLADATAQIGGADADVLYAGRQGELAGLDQLNIRLNRNLIGRGELDLLCNIAGRSANTVRINVK